MTALDIMNQRLLAILRLHAYTQQFIALFTSFTTLCVILISNETIDGQHSATRQFSRSKFGGIITCRLPPYHYTRPHKVISLFLVQPFFIDQATIYIYIYILEVSDCDILRHHDSKIMTYHDCENYHNCHILQIFGTNKQAVVYKNHVTVLI